MIVGKEKGKDWPRVSLTKKNAARASAKRLPPQHSLSCGHTLTAFQQRVTRHSFGRGLTLLVFFFFLSFFWPFPVIVRKEWPRKKSKRKRDAVLSATEEGENAIGAILVATRILAFCCRTVSKCLSPSAHNAVELPIIYNT